MFEVYYPEQLCTNGCHMYYRSSEEALAVLLKFKHIETTEAIRERLMSKFSHILQQFMKEILSVETEFNVRSGP
jgi:hypothetical protein